MKRITALFLAFVILLASCSGKTQPDDYQDISFEKNDDTKVTEREGDDKVPEKDEEMSYAAWSENAYTYLNAMTIDKDGESSLITDDSNVLAWNTYYYLYGMYRGYCATGDIAFLEQYAIYIYRVYQLMSDNDGDGYLSWGKAYVEGDKEYGYNEYAVHVGLIVSCAGNFACLVYGDENLAQMQSPFGITYKDIADFLIDRSVNHAIPSFDCDWNEDIGAYMNRPGSYNYGGAEEEMSLPHNQYLCMALAMMSFAKVSPEHREEYVRKSEKMFETFKNTIRFYDDLGIAVWNYQDSLFEGDHGGRTEDYSHGMLDVLAAIIAYENGLAFTLKDIDTLTKTYETIMYRGPSYAPKLTTYVTGEGAYEGGMCSTGLEMSVYGNQLNLERGMRYRINQGAKTCQDAPWILAFHEDTPKPEEFSLAMPANGEEQVDPNSAAFIWQRTACANYYRLQIATDSDFNDVIVERDRIIDSSVIVTSLPKNAELYYRVIAMNMSGEETVSDIYSFKTAE